MTWLEEERDVLRQRLRAVEALLAEKNMWMPHGDKPLDQLVQDIRNIVESTYGKNLDACREFIAHTKDEYGERMPKQWHAHARALLDSLKENGSE